MACLQPHQAQLPAAAGWQRRVALAPKVPICVLRKRSREAEENSDTDTSHDTVASGDSDSGSDYDGVSTPDQDPEPISKVGAEFRQKIQMHKARGPSKANYAPKTRIAIERGKAYFNEYVFVLSK